MTDQRIEVPAEWASVERLAEFTDQVEAVMPLTSEQNYLLRMVIEEIATNIIKYGYSGMTDGMIYFTCSCVDGVMRLVIRDKGHPFDPRDQPDPDLTEDIGDRSVGGLGLFLVREFADHVSYHHDGSSGWNELVVVKG